MLFNVAYVSGLSIFDFPLDFTIVYLLDNAYMALIYVNLSIG
jgi:hypothetical protein